MTSQATQPEARGLPRREKATSWLGDHSAAPPPAMVSDPVFACLTLPPCGANWRLRVGLQATLPATSKAAG